MIAQPFNGSLTSNQKNRLNLIMQEVVHFWEQGPHSHFTLQGPSHSERVYRQLAQLAQELPENERLTQDEIFIISAAAWLYEIGMQSTTLRPILDFDWQPDIPLSPIQLLQIREKKHLLTYRMIVDSVRHDYSGPLLRLGLVQPDDYTQLIAEVCRWCSSEPLVSVPEILPVSGVIVRVRLLVVLLRLADQLYIDSSRVNLDLLQTSPLPPKQKARWWAYHYTQALPVDKGLIRFYYFLPDVHRDLLGNIRALIEPEFDYDANPLMRYLVREHHLKLLIGEPSVRYDQPAGFQREMSKEMILYLRQYIRPLDLDTKKPKDLPQAQQGLSIRGHTEQLRHVLDSSLNNVLLLHSSTNTGAQHSMAIKGFHTFTRLLKWEVLDIEVAVYGPSSLPTSLSTLLTESKKYTSNRERAEHSLQLARVYGEHGDEVFLRYALAEYCFWRGWQRSHGSKREARPYLQSFLFLNSQMSPDGQHIFIRTLYQTLSLYFGTYNFGVDVKESPTLEIPSKFYNSLLQTLAKVGKGQYEALGRCIVEIAAVNFSFISDLLNRIKTRKDTQYFQTIATSLQEGRVFRTDPFYCLQLLARIDVTMVASVLSKQYLASAEERRQVVNALLAVAHAPNAPSPTVLLQGFASQAPLEIRARLAFSLLVEPFVLNKPEQESDLKALLIAEALGLPSGQPDTEFFLGIATELSLLFDRFFSSPNPNVKGGFAITILEKIRVTRKKLLEGMRVNQENRSLRDTVNTFFRGTESYVTGEQAKLIRDTTLELMLVSDRTLYSPQRTRITVEIRNIGEGIADRLALEIFSVSGKYEVAERDRLHTIEILADKIPLQKELFIQPLVGSDESIELSLILRYDTLKKQNKVAELPPSNRTVRFYAANQFVRAKQPYSMSAPATTWFYGRKNQLESIADNLREGTEHDTSMIVYGLKRAGKTSVVKRFIEHTFQARGLSQTHIPIYADLLLRPQLIRTDGDFLHFLIEIIVRELSSPKRQLSLPFTLSQVREEFQHSPLEAFATYLDGILQALGNQRLLLVLDEFSALYRELNGDRSLTPEMFGFLSNMIQSTHQLTFIFTGTYVLLDMMRTYMSDLAKICIPYMISFLDDTSARQLITVPLQRDPDNLAKGWLEYDSRVVDRIVTYTNRHPYLIQCVCHLLVERMNELKDQRVNLNDLDAIVQNITTVPANENMMLNLWGEFSKPQQKVLSVIASLSNTNLSWVESSEIMLSFKEAGEMISVEDIEKICNNLTEAELLEKNSSAVEQNDAYRITIPLYHMWLKYYKPIRAVFSKRSVESSSYQFEEH
jgi:AAA domain